MPAAPATGEPAAVSPGWSVIGTAPIDTVTWLPVSVSLINQIVAGTAAGFGIFQTTASPFVVLASMAQSGQTGALTVTWA